MILEILFFLVFISLLFYTVTYPYNFKLNRKLKRVLNFNQVEKIANPKIRYQEFSHKELFEELIIEEKYLKTKYTTENMRVLILRPKVISETPLCLVLLHGIRDKAEDWIYKAKLRENYLSLKKSGRVKDIIFILPDSGYNGESWYTNFYKDQSHQYEEFFSKDLTNFIEREYPNSKKGIGGFSMGGYGALKIGLKNLESYDVIASFSGAISLIRMSINRRVMRIFRYLYVPQFLFNDVNKAHFMKVFSPWGYKILKNDPYSIIKKTNPEKYKGKKFYLSVGSEDKKPYLMLQQWLDVVGRAKKYGLDFKGKIYENEYHTWEYISKDIYNFLVFFTEETKKRK
ncbi:MAG: alpha/beta hydrolase [Cetobacterium sp.]|uniref:alpha/beta hydrolase n=1 Tax=Cetobacterium TaxID=180162 RepID=UPI001F051CED|nr:alpha/beta hydrolase-fold protein [Cetobacterium somerae]MCX3066246.1 alpha/beta hydrolase-fold protein [Cetobacterium somerae]UPO96722.1 alpha/beta hydrolase-fold protein [Cetobacterium somerae]